MRNKRNDKAEAVATAEGRHDTAIFETRARGIDQALPDPSTTIEITDADYRSLHLPCDALEEKGDRKPRRTPGIAVR